MRRSFQPHRLDDDVKDALKGLGVDGITITEVRGHGRQKGHTETYRGWEYTIDLLPKVELELVAADARVEEIVGALKARPRDRSGKIGDGKIFVSPVEGTIRIRNGERGKARCSGNCLSCRLRVGIINKGLLYLFVNRRTGKVKNARRLAPRLTLLLLPSIPTSRFQDWARPWAKPSGS